MRLIDADTLKEAIKNDMYVVDYGVEGAIYGMFWSGIEYEIDEQPTVEQKTGKWIKAQYPFEQCSVCGAYFDTNSNEANYCCVCGTRMEGEKK